jgi:hypothetical protein
VVTREPLECPAGVRIGGERAHERRFQICVRFNSRSLEHMQRNKCRGGKKRVEAQFGRKREAANIAHVG